MTQEKTRNEYPLYGMSVAEVARALGISTTRVQQLEANAIRRIRKGLAARGYDVEVLDLPAWMIEDIFEQGLRAQALEINNSRAVRPGRRPAPIRQSHDYREQVYPRAG